MRTTLMAEVVSGLQIGIEYNLEADAFSPLVSWRAVSEGEYRPAVIFGTSSDRIGTPSGQSYYVTFSKGFRVGDVGLAPYVGATYGEFEDALRPIGGLNLGIDEHWSMLFIHDGVNFHPTVTYSTGPHDISLLFIDLEYFGLAWSVRF